MPEACLERDPPICLWVWWSYEGGGEPFAVRPGPALPHTPLQRRVAQAQRDGAQHEKAHQRRPQPVQAEQRNQRRPGREIQRERPQHGVAHVPRPRGADEDSVEHEGRQADHRGQRRPGQVFAGRRPHLGRRVGSVGGEDADADISSVDLKAVD